MVSLLSTVHWTITQFLVEHSLKDPNPNLKNVFRPKSQKKQQQERSASAQS